MPTALICIDFITDIIGEGGKLSGKGYLAFANERSTLTTLADLQSRFRAAGQPVIHVRVGFDPSYLNHPGHSPLFGAAAQYQALKQGAAGTEFVAPTAPADGELVFWKPRVSAFFSTPLELALRAQGVTEVVIAGVATDLAVESAVRDAHDRDFSVIIPHDACAAASVEDHEGALKVLAKIAKVVDSATVQPIA